MHLDRQEQQYNKEKKLLNIHIYMVPARMTAKVKMSPL